MRHPPIPRASPGSGAARADPLTDDIGDDLVFEGKVARITTTGRHTGLPRPVAVGYVEEPDGSVLVAAGESARWALNLLDQPRVDVEIGDRAFSAVAEALDAADHARAIRGLILRYGTPAERLGRGPSFRLRPIGKGGV
jgi:deazaflavin-dependent oxidoreductase (nitroreductase family)